jgi:hypothetical protein
MSNITLFKQGNVAVPDFLRQSDDITKMLAGGGSGKQISIKGGVWRMIVGGEEIAKNEDRAMNFVVVAAAPKVHRTFYMGKYEEGKDVGPTCWSADGVKPNEEVPEAQRQCGTCDKCPQNIEGSGEGKSRACRYSRRLAVVLENDLEGNIYRLQLPAKSMFGKPDGDKMPLDAYAKFLAGHGVPITGVVTEARFDTSEAVPVLKFRAVRPLTREEWELAQVASASEDAKRAVEFKMVVSNKRGETPVESSEYKEAAPKAEKPTKVEAEAVEEPVKRPSKAKAETPAASKNVNDILKDWNEDDDE